MSTQAVPEAAATVHRYTAFDPLLDQKQAASMVELCRRFGAYGMYSEEPTFGGIGEGLPARFDAARNFVKSGGRFARHEPIETLGARTNYFRETYAYGHEERIEGIEPLLRHEGLIEAARALHGRPVVEPAIVYANLLVPGQELAVHTDVPEFRGISRKRHAQWLIVVMHHSRLFDRYRMPIATGISWFHDCNGGELAFYPNGADAPPRAHRVRYNTALLLDTDSVFHGVDRVAETAEPIAALLPGMRLVWDGDDDWSVRDGERVVARYRWPELRFSISWKAYCFADEAEREAWRSHTDDLDPDTVVPTLLADLRRRGRLEGPDPEGHDLVTLLIDEYVHFPDPELSRRQSVDD